MGLFVVILKILGCILAVFLLIFFMVLFVPVRYRIAAGVQEGTTVGPDAGTGNAYFGTVWVSWLFGVIRARYDWESKQVQIKLLFFDLSKFITGTTDERDAPAEISAGPEEGPEIKKAEEKPEEKPEEKERPKKEILDEKTKNEKPKKKKEKKENKSSKEGILDKIKEMRTSVEKIVNYQDRDKIIKLSVKLLKRLWRAVKPRHLELDALVGFEDPSLTGYILGAAGIIRGLTSWRVEVKGDFGQKILRLNLNVRSRIIIGELVWPLFMYVLHMWKHFKIFMGWRKKHGQ